MGFGAMAVMCSPVLLPAAVTAQLLPSTCVLTISNSGVLASNENATELGSEQNGGRAAALSVTATGLTPTITFNAPTLVDRPGSYSRTPVVSLKYTSVAGANQPFTTTGSGYRSALLTDLITINAKAVDPIGFSAGNYRLVTTATCQN
jgi:hypothetical protein